MPPGMLPQMAQQMNHYTTPQPVYGKAPMRENSMDDLNINGFNNQAGITTMHTSNPNLQSQVSQMLGPMGYDENGKPVKIQRTQLNKLQPAGSKATNFDIFGGGLTDQIMGHAS